MLLTIRFDNGFEWVLASGNRKVWDQALASNSRKVLLKGIGGGTIQTPRKVLLKDFAHPTP